MARENITLNRSAIYRFENDNVGLYKIVAHKIGTSPTDENAIYATRTIRVIDPTPVGNITPSTTPGQAFITGTDAKYFSILYNLNQEYEYTINELNDAAYTYIKDWNSIASDDKKIPINDSPNERPKYFGEDSKGIFALLDSSGYNLESYDESNIYIAGDNKYIKAYIKGTCSIVDTNYNTITNDADMVPSIIYPLTFNPGGTKAKIETYLFINSSIQLLRYVNTSQKTFRQIDSVDVNSYTECNVPSSLLVSKSLQQCQQNGNYILKLIEADNYTINTTSEPINTNDKKLAMMIYNGTTRNLIIPETVKKISHFCGAGASNSQTITLPASLVEIGESAFESISGGAIKLREYNDNLKIIGKRAFCDISNIQLFEYNIEQYKSFILNNVCSDEGWHPILKLNREQLSKVLDKLLSKSVKSICLLPRIDTIGELAFAGAKNSTSIKNIIFSNIHTSVDPLAFAYSDLVNIIIPDRLIARPFSAEQPGIISQPSLLYLPEKAIDLACSTINSSYQYNMKDTVYVEQGTSGYGYEYENSSLTWITSDTYDYYKTHSKAKKTFAYINQSASQTYYFIHDASDETSE